MLKGEAFGFLGSDLRHVRKRKDNGYYLHQNPKKKKKKKKARCAIKARVRDIMGMPGSLG